MTEIKSAVERDYLGLYVGARVSVIEGNRDRNRTKTTEPHGFLSAYICGRTAKDVKSKSDAF